MICQSLIWSFLPCVVLWYYSFCLWLEAQRLRLLHEAGNRCWLGQGRTGTKWGALWDLTCPFITPSGERWSRPRKDCWLPFQDRPCKRMRGKYSWVLYSRILGEGSALFCRLLWFEMWPERLRCRISPAWAEEGKTSHWKGIFVIV